MTINETLTMTAFMLAPAFFSLLGLAALGSPIIALLGELTARFQGKVFYDKYGQQTATMGVLLTLLTIIVEIVGLTVAYIKFPSLFQEWITANSPFAGAGIAMVLFLFFSVTYSLTWKRLRPYKIIHTIIGIGAASAAIALIILGIFPKLTVAGSEEVLPQIVHSILAPLTGMYLILTVAAAAGLSCLYLVFRRKKDDFGRDYYNFALKLASRWALFFSIPFLGCQSWLFLALPQTIQTIVLGTPLGLVWGVGAVLTLICILIWGGLARSQSPLQLKGLTLVTFILMWLMHTMNVTVFVNFMMMI